MNDQRADDPSRLRRQKRLEEQMKENLKRRKAQARARRDGQAAQSSSSTAADGTPDEPAAD